MPPAKKPASEKAVFEKPISFRWNTTKYDHHKTAFDILKGYLKDGYELREIFASAMQHFAGQKVKGGTQQDVLTRLKRIEGKIDEQTEQNALIVDALRNMDLSAFVHQDTGRTFRDELGERVPDSAYNQINQTVSSADFDVD